jgi:CubicO group peptidase (beta-lactamase class C family)
MCTEANPAHGGYTTSLDLAHLYGALLRARSGEEVDGLPSPETVRAFTSPQRPRSFDGVLGRECTYGFGFMTDLAEHAFGSRCPATSFGHSGNVGSTFAFADPERDVAVAVVFNGIVDPDSAFLRRPALVAAVYRDLDELDTAVDPEGETAGGTDLDGDRAGTKRRFWRRR